MKRSLALLLIVVSCVALNFLLLKYFNTLLWPYLWPQPAIFILIGFFAAAVWFRELFQGIWRLRWIGLLMIFIGQSYFVHSVEVTIQHFSLTSVVHLIGFTGTFSVMILNYINQIWPKSNRKPPSLPVDLPYVAAVVPTYGEPCDILEQTIRYLKQLDYPVERLYILISDDGHRAEVRRLAEQFNIHYHLGAKKDAKAGNLNSALAHLEKHCPQATLILTQDADELIAPSFLQKVVGYFEDPQIAFVQTPKEAFTPKGDPFGNRDRVFYDILQPGRNGSGAAFSCGSGVVWRISAIKEVGGFSTWNLVEDMTTSYFLHCAGYHSEYHNEILTIGLSPDDIPGLLKQRGTWAADTWRFFIFNNPLWKVGHLSVRQRLQYLELGMFYVSSTVFMPLLMMTPILSLFTGDFIPIEGAALFPWIGISILYYLALAKGNITFLRRMWQYWIGHWPTYTKALWIAIRSRRKKPSYKVTRKTRQNGFYGHLLWPQFLYLFLGLSAIVYSLFMLPGVKPATLWTNIGILLFFMYLVSRICRTAFYGLNFDSVPGLARSRQALNQTLASLAHSLAPVQPQTVTRPPLTIRTARSLPTHPRLILQIGMLMLIFLSVDGVSRGLIDQSKADLQPSIPVKPAQTQHIEAALPPLEPVAAALLVPIPIQSSPTPTTSPTQVALVLPTVTQTPSPTATASPALPAPTKTPSPLPMAPLPKPLTVITSPTSSPAATTKYAAPILLEPSIDSNFNAGSRLTLQWQPVGKLAPNEQYAVRLVYRFQNEVVYGGHQVTETEWTIPQWLFGRADGPDYHYDWFVYVERVNTDGSTTMLSPSSELHSFTWR